MRRGGKDLAQDGNLSSTVLKVGIGKDVLLCNIFSRFDVLTIKIFRTKLVSSTFLSFRGHFIKYFGYSHVGLGCIAKGAPTVQVEGFSSLSKFFDHWSLVISFASGLFRGCHVMLSVAWHPSEGCERYKKQHLGKLTLIEGGSGAYCKPHDRRKNHLKPKKRKKMRSKPKTACKTVKTDTFSHPSY